MMKKTAVLTTTIVVLLISNLCLAGQPLKVGEKAPNWILSNDRGQNISFYQDSAGSRAVMLFWATWCAKCADLMPHLQGLQEELQNKDVKFYALNIWEEANARQFMAQHGYDFTLLLNADLVAKRYSIKGTPGLLVVDENKMIQYVRIKDTSTLEAIAHVKNALLSNTDKN